MFSKSKGPATNPVVTYGRVRRFRVGQAVVLNAGRPWASRHIIREAVCDPFDSRDANGFIFTNGDGVSAKYWLSDHEGWAYDWQLDPTRKTFQETLECLFHRLLS